MLNLDSAPQLVLTHGWGTNSTEWYYMKRHLAGQFRLIVWDLPGLGETEQPTDKGVLSSRWRQTFTRFSLALQKPLAEPILHLMIPFSALVRIANWISLPRRVSLWRNASSSFAGTETRGQLDLVSRFQFEWSPGVVARGTLAMFHWDATPVLPQIKVPVLILVGKQDATTVPRASTTMQRSIPGAQTQVVDRSRHYALLEKNQVVDDAVSEFAATVLR
jgi:pimeloyl-ACP methyl ester carboxylesterase